MLRYILGRLGIIVISVLGLITLSFGLVSLIPGDPARVILGDYATPSAVAQTRHRLGLDKPFLQRYIDYVWQVLHGNLGRSYFSNESVGHDILIRLPTSLVLLIPGLLLAMGFGVAVGSCSAYLRGRAPDRIARSGIALVQAVPEFVIGLLLIYVFVAEAKIAPQPVGMLGPSDFVPNGGAGSIPVEAVLGGDWSTVLSILDHALLPILTLGIFFSAYFAKATRSGLATALASPQVEFARACGLRERTVFLYAMSTVRTSLLTYMAILFGTALGGAAIVENLFSWPGVGNWSLQGVLNGDIPVMQGFVLTMGLATLLVYLALDVSVALLDPRVRRGWVKSL